MNIHNKSTLMWFKIITIFPDMFHAITNYGITGKAIKKKIIEINVLNLRNFSQNKYKSIDDRPYGGGPGMLINAEPLYFAIKRAKYLFQDSTVIYLSPQGKKLRQENIPELIKKKKIIFICGRYEGIDQRIIDKKVDEEWSIGNYILTGGELAAMVIIDAISRLIPGTVNKKQSVEEDSFSNNLLDYPNYTRPEIFNGISVPKILLSGNHEKIRLWRLKKSIKKTWIKRPDLIQNKTLKKEEEILLETFKKKYFKKNKR